MHKDVAFQDQIPNNHCFGCGPDNQQGLQIKSYWHGEDESICRFMPAPHHAAGPTKYLNGGIISTIIDCHSVCTAIAKAYAMAGREIGSGETIWFATGGLNVTFKKPVAIDREVVLKAKIETVKEHKVSLTCTLSSGDDICVESRVVAVKVPDTWL